MDDDNAQKRAHQVVFIKEDADRGIDAQLRECVGQQKRQHVHDLVDFVTAEATRAGKAAAACCAGTHPAEQRVLPLQGGNLVGYTVPQHIHLDADFSVVELFFRVRAVCGASRIVLTDETGAQLAAFPRQRLAPGEMENLRLSRALLDRAQGSVTVSIEEAAK